MLEALLDSENGRRLRLHSFRRDMYDYVATLELPDGSGSITVIDNESTNGLPAFVRSLADAWQGFGGVKQYESLEGHLAFSCRHDGLGIVSCDVALRQVFSPEWSMRAVLEFGSGAHLERIAASVESFFGGA